MHGLTDQQLLRDYAERRSEAAFAELVRRHVDFVYSAARRMVHDAHLAQDVTQGAFVALAQHARKLTDRPVFSGWLHRTAQNLAAKTIRSAVRRRAREQEAALMNNLHEPDAVWEEIVPQLDAALGDLSEGDRDAVLLRYFEGKSAREMAHTLGTSEEAAQKRVSRAVERLREFFAQRGVTIGVSALLGAISANAVQAAPIGLAAMISTAAALAGTTIAATVTATKALAMTTLHKAIVGATLAVAIGIGIYEVLHHSRSGDEVSTRAREQPRLTGQIEQSPRASSRRTNNRSPSISAVGQPNPRVFVGGEVHVPGPKVWTQGMKLTDAIRQAEMLSAFAAKQVTVKDPGGTTSTYDLQRILNGSAENPLLKPGDVLVVPRSEALTTVDPRAQIHVSGAVVLPSHWAWTNGMK